MIQASGVIICLGYIFGLLSTATPWGGIWVLVLGIVAAILFRWRKLVTQKASEKTKNPTAKTKIAPQAPQNLPKSRVWLAAGIIGLLASLYLPMRIPQPKPNDISKFLPLENNNPQEQLFIVRGNAASMPRMTRSQRGQFWLEATQLYKIQNQDGSAGVGQSVSGKLYVTVPLVEATGLYPGQLLAITGTLYKPKAAFNPGSFDFQKYLQQQGAFAGLSGRQISVLDDKPEWGLWKLRETIVRSQVRTLGIPEGALLSTMVLGSKAVDLPYDIKDLFVNVGLAHVLGSPGFKTSLILGIVLALTRRRSKVTQIILGTIALIIFLGLTGFQAATVKAAIMGFAVLIGIGLKRKVKRLGLLLLTAVALLLFNPLLIWDLGFQLSFLATLGLLTTAQPIIKCLEWLPPTIAALIALPLAASIWTLPLLLHNFSVVAIYSLPANIITSPLISVITIGGIISALTSLVLADVGTTFFAWLYYPTHWLLEISHFFAHLPGSSIAVGSISILQMLAIYTIIIMTWLVGWWQKRWWFATLIAIGLVLVPAWHSATTLFKVTVLAAGEEPVLVIQDRGKVTVINSGQEGTGRFSIVPFLQQQGVNQIDWAVATHFQNNTKNSWLEVLQYLPIKNFYEYPQKSDNASVSAAIQQELQTKKQVYLPVPVGQAVNIGSSVIQLIDNQPPILQLQIQGNSWLLMGNLTPSQLHQFLKPGGLPHPQFLWCSGESLKELVLALQPQVAIASNNSIDPKDFADLSTSQTKLLFTKRDGAVEWTPGGDFQPFVQTTENSNSVF